MSYTPAQSELYSRPDFTPESLALGDPIGRDGPTFAVMKLLYAPAPGDAAYFTLHRKEPKGPTCRSGFRNLTSWPVADLDTLLPTIRDHIMRDTYHSVNLFYRPGLEWSTRKDGRVIRRPPFLPHLLPTYRANDGTRYLSACYVDIDCDEVGLTPGGVLGVAYELGRQKRIPPFSVFVNSGHGCWLLWRLRETDAPLPVGNALPTNPRAWPERQDLYRRIQATVTHLPELVALGADYIKDPARIMRLAGSVNTSADKTVYALPQLVDGRLPSYTLEELAAAFGVVVPDPLRQAFAPIELPDSPQQWLPDPDRPRVPKRANGLRMRWQYVLADINAVIAMRGGRLYEGCRQPGCCALATALRHLRVNDDDARRLVHALAEASDLPPEEADRALVAAAQYATAQPAYREFSNWLKVTPEESEDLNKLPEAGCAPSPSVFREKRTTAERRDALRRYIDDLGLVPPILDGVAFLAASGYPVCYESVRRDYLKLALRREETRGRRPKRALF